MKYPQTVEESNKAIVAFRSENLSPFAGSLKIEINLRNDVEEFERNKIRFKGESVQVYEWEDAKCQMLVIKTLDFEQGKEPKDKEIEVKYTKIRLRDFLKVAEMLKVLYEEKVKKEDEP